MALGILLDRIDPGCPYQNGGHERMHLDMKKELEGQIDDDLHEHQVVFDEWREQFNTERPHQALKGKSPAEVYQKSETKYDPGLEELQYPRGFKARKVNDRGVMSFGGRRYFIGNSFAGYSVGICMKKYGVPEVWFASRVLGILNIETGLINFTMAFKLTKAS
jgi:putative transposase